MRGYIKNWSPIALRICRFRCVYYLEYFNNKEKCNNALASEATVFIYLYENIKWDFYE